MVIQLHNLQARGRKKKKRVGRGNASGHGTYSTRGQKGQRARSGGRGGLKYLGMKAMIANFPKKRGFHSDKPKFQLVNICSLEANFEDGERVTPDILLKREILHTIQPGVKVLASGKLSKKLHVFAHAFSKQAERAIKDAGGTVMRLTATRDVTHHKSHKKK